MCGIVGYWSPERRAASLEALLAMTAAIRHRGPDDEGYVAVDARSRRARSLRGHLSRGEPDADGVDPRDPFAHDVGMGHVRFSIVDLSDAGHQPFWSADRSAALAFNGEIYNHVELREELAKRGRRFRSSSDTEVLLAAYEEWGLECFARLRGFWALSLYDLRRRRLVLSRDRIGKSPLYLRTVDGTLYWASEIKALAAATGRRAFPTEPQAIHDFVHHGWRDVDHGTFYRGVRTLPNASFAVLEKGVEVRPQRYWSLPERRVPERQLPFADACRELRRHLDEAVSLRERADVPLAMELSGGMDSSALVALRAHRTERPFAAYSVLFDDPSADETPYAEAVAHRYRDAIEHRIVRAPLLEFWEQADAFVAHMDESFHSPNVVTAQGIRRRIRADGFKVVVTGAAGDELLAGYPSEYRAPLVRDLLARGRLTTAAREILALPNRRGFLRQVIAPPAPAEVPEVQRRLLSLRDHRRNAPPDGFDARMRGNWGPWKMNYWLRVSNTMDYALPIEPRAPFMDHRLAEFCFRLPGSYLIRAGWTKYVLRRAVEDLLPPDVVWRRRKMGFPFPIRPWLRASKARVLAGCTGDMPDGVDLRALPGAYDGLVETAPLWLWRLVSVALWHRRCNLGDTIDA